MSKCKGLFGGDTWQICYWGYFIKGLSFIKEMNTVILKSSLIYFRNPFTEPRVEILKLNTVLFLYCSDTWNKASGIYENHVPLLRHFYSICLKASCFTVYHRPQFLINISKIFFFFFKKGGIPPFLSWNSRKNESRYFSTFGFPTA